MNKTKNPYSIKVIWQLIRHGLILQGVRYGFAKIGLDFMPYYWAQEEVIRSEKPTIKLDKNEVLFKSLNERDIKKVYAESDSITKKKIDQSKEAGQECVGLEYKEKVVAFMFIELNDFVFKNRLFKIKKNEAYLLNMYTFDSFRGMGLAPYLRYSCYRYLEDRNITVKYSISNYFNKSAIGFKKKLNCKHLMLLMNIELFGRFKWHVVLKKYD